MANGGRRRPTVFVLPAPATVKVCKEREREREKETASDSGTVITTERLKAEEKISDQMVKICGFEVFLIIIGLNRMIGVIRLARMVREREREREK